MIYEKRIIKDSIIIQGIYDVLNIVLLHFLEIDCIAISIFGVFDNGYVYSSFIEGINFKQILKCKYNKHIVKY